MPMSLFTRRTFLWLGIAVVLVTAGLVVGEFALRAKTLRTPVAAYLVPIDNNCRVKPAWWHTVRLAAPLTLRSGERVWIPAGTSVRLIHADTGTAETVTGPTKLFLQQKRPDDTAALISPLAEVADTFSKKVQPERGIIITSPISVTRYRNPLITWQAAEGRLYDVVVADPSDPYIPLRVAHHMRPPILLSALQTPQEHQLAADRIYEIAVAVSDQPEIHGTARFLTSPNASLNAELPTTPADLIAEAAAAMSEKPPRTGDAWLALSRLPDDWAKSELGLRLRLRVNAELGLPLPAVSRDALQRLMKP